MEINGVKQPVNKPVLFDWTCHFCHRGFSSYGLPHLEHRAEMVCDECADTYDAKVMAGYRLEGPALVAAHKVASLPPFVRRLEVAHWQHLADTTSNALFRAERLAMIAEATKVGLGIKNAPEAPQRSQKRRQWEARGA